MLAKAVAVCEKSGTSKIDSENNRLTLVGEEQSRGLSEVLTNDVFIFCVQASGSLAL